MSTRPGLWKLAIAAGLLVFVTGCGPKIEPEIASAAGEATYATDYPSELTSEMDRLNNAESKTKELSGKFGGYPDALKSPPWPRVIEIVDKADAEGRAYAYVDARREVDGAYAFFETEKDEITKKVAGAAQFAAKQKGCEADVSGAAAHALKETVEKRLKEYLRERSEAHIYIARNEAALGKENIDKLEEQADEIALASYLAFVVAVEHKVKVRRMLEEGERVKQTLDASLKAEQAYQGESGRKPEEKKASEQRLEAMRKASAGVDAAVMQAKGVSERADERVVAIQKVYTDAMQKLKDDLKKRAGQ
jgi:hypothetical protein